MAGRATPLSCLRALQVPCRSVDFQVFDSLRGDREKILNAKLIRFMERVTSLVIVR
jgi:hypothetical protein